MPSAQRGPNWSATQPTIGEPIGVQPKAIARRIAITRPRIEGSVDSCIRLLVEFENVSAETQQMIATALNLPQGAVFNEGAVIGITAARDTNPDLQRFFATESMYYTLNIHDDSHTVDVDFTPAKRN